MTEEQIKEANRRAAEKDRRGLPRKASSRRQAQKKGLTLTIHIPLQQLVVPTLLALAYIFIAAPVSEPVISSNTPSCVQQTSTAKPERKIASIKKIQKSTKKKVQVSFENSNDRAPASAVVIEPKNADADLESALQVDEEFMVNLKRNLDLTKKN